VSAPGLDVLVVGAGPNGLTAAVTLAAAGVSVDVREASDTVGGAASTAELTLPGFRHDVGSAVHPFAAGSPVFRSLPLADHGLEWLEPDLALAHPFTHGDAAVLERSLARTVERLGRGYGRLVRPFVGRWDDLAPDVLRSLVSPLPRHPLLLARFGVRALPPVALTARRLRNPAGASLLSGMAGHTGVPLSAAVTSGPALMLTLAAHEVSWPIPRGGAQAISDALVGCLRSLGGTVTTGQPVTSLDALPAARAYLLDVAPSAVAALTGARLPGRYTRRLGHYRLGPGVFKVDYALSEPVPWRDPACRQAGTVHLGGTVDEIGATLTAIARGEAPARPFVVAAQPSLVDPSRAPAGRHTFWAYAHVPNAWPGDLTDAIETQIERFAPGFRDVVLARSVSSPAALEAGNANLVGGDLANGAVRGRQAVFRPLVAAVPYATPHPAVFLCSAATPPGPGVHGMCGYQAARVVLRRVVGRRDTRGDEGARAGG